jgi:hypothetical protein
MPEPTEDKPLKSEGDLATQPVESSQPTLGQKLKRIFFPRSRSGWVFAIILGILLAVLLHRPSILSGFWPKTTPPIAQVVGPEPARWFSGPKPKVTHYYVSFYDSMLAKRNQEGWRTYAEVTVDLKFNRDFTGLVLAAFKGGWKDINLKAWCKDSLIVTRDIDWRPWEEDKNIETRIINPVSIDDKAQPFIVTLFRNDRVRIGNFKEGETYRVVIESPDSQEGRFADLEEIYLFEWDGQRFVTEDGFNKKIRVWGKECMDDE